MIKIWAWTRENKISVVLTVILVWVLLRGRVVQSDLVVQDAGFGISGDMAGRSATLESIPSESMILPPVDEVPPSTGEDRLVVRESSLSLQVDDVAGSIAMIESVAVENGGFMVNSNISSPYEGATGYITIRVPSDKRGDVLNLLRDSAVKVVSESTFGSDVTDQYEDIGEKLRILEETKAKFEEILDQATQVNDILNVQQRIISVQAQIDSLRGRQEYLEKTAELSLITVNLSTDEFALPYAPDEVWRPQVVFKLAVRSLVRTFRRAADLLIWLVVYGALLVPLYYIGRMIYRKISR